MFKPAVFAGKPEALEDFDKQEVDGINVYVSKDVKAKNGEIRVKLRGFGFFKHLYLDGV